MHIFMKTPSEKSLLLIISIVLTKCRVGCIFIRYGKKNGGQFMGPTFHLM